MKLQSIFEKHQLSEFYVHTSDWLIQNGIDLDPETDYVIDEKPELTGGGLDSAYAIFGSDFSGLLIDTSAGWEFRNSDSGMWTPIVFFTKSGQICLQELGFNN